MSSKKLIKNAYELVEFIRVNAPGLYNHQWEMDGDLDSFCYQNLIDEADALEAYFDRAIDGKDNNYVPDYYGCGLLSRALKISRGNVSHKLFRNLGLCLVYDGDDESGKATYLYDKEKAESMASWSGWY